MSRRHLASILFTGVILLGCATGCTSNGQDSQDGLAPQNLNVQMAITDPQTTFLGVEGSYVSIKVTLFEDLNYSQARAAVSESDSFSCDGTTFVRDGSLQYSFLRSIPAAQVQGDQSCAYTHDGKSTRFSFATPQRPVILAPLPNASISTTQNLTVQFTPSQTEPTVLAIDGKPAITLAQPIGEAIIPSQVLRQFLPSTATLTLMASETSLLTPVSEFNDLEIEYTSSTLLPLSISN
jgi:hypothetical protein